MSSWWTRTVISQQKRRQHCTMRRWEIVKHFYEQSVWRFYLTNHGHTIRRWSVLLTHLYGRKGGQTHVWEMGREDMDKDPHML